MRIQRNAKLAGFAAAVGVASVIAITPPAIAAEDQAPPQRTEVTLEATGYDAAVAVANGFKIITYEDGSWESVAVTPAAEALDAETGIISPEGAVAARGSVTSNCGTAWVDAVAYGRRVEVTTGYSVVAPVYNRVGWAVTLWTSQGIPTINWPNGPSGATWQGNPGGVIFGTATGGSAIAGGSVFLINGSVCSAGLPSDTF